MIKKKNSLTPEQAYPKIAHYCAYQERCHKEVRQKLYDLGLYGADIEKLISRLIEEDYLNEERFAIQFAGGRFRMKNWGRVKITHELKQRGVSAYCIKKALKGIGEEDYSEALEKLIDKKMDLMPGDNKLLKKKKLTEYLMQKGFELNQFLPLIEDRLMKKGQKVPKNKKGSE